MNQIKYGLTHIAKLEIAIKDQLTDVKSTEQYNNKGVFGLTVEFDTTDAPVEFRPFNRMVQRYNCSIVQVASYGGYTDRRTGKVYPNTVAFSIEQDN